MSSVGPYAEIDGVSWGRIRASSDVRGSFRELWRASVFDLDQRSAGTTDPRFVQVNLSTSSAGALRGLHYHRRQLDHWVIAAGRVFVALVDVRPAMTGGRPVVRTRDMTVDDTVTIPVGVAHGFLARERTQLIYLVTNEYDGTDELGFAWNDPIAAVPWPRADTADGQPMLSERDAQSPTLADLLRQLR